MAIIFDKTRIISGYLVRTKIQTVPPNPNRPDGFKVNFVNKFNLSLIIRIIEKTSVFKIKVSSFETAHIQEAHITIIHSICESLDELARKEKGV